MCRKRRPGKKNTRDNLVPLQQMLGEMDGGKIVPSEDELKYTVDIPLD